ncbi:DUF4376 domain-containing protein [Campylobacter hyointestinalis subsp. hyointestinalis]|uniref:DUF4376 domain-containing protein n=1 Tax=Campylobacter hyointestinalis TaxID=198 RepID=UPI00072B5D57|nr:DUF4376 domain-containing protein [Campylobacter hyointestinalis]PPB57572.1 hypothetical protein CDQ71_06780 [Campylobacter hyointestinalis subsp. hyointestinalis]QCT99368.1 DUF4376 domain-containing protein [Campylobacter hyointestinalis subsp. hyointestinalis]CUU82418.1 3-deoxy-D-arabino-heptulosonate 7-phosphate synthase [Campylobacter hyointestinalis subsp. hyointestinalis]
MKLYDIQNKEVVSFEYISSDEGIFYTKFLSKEELLNFGYKKAVVADYPENNDTYKKIEEITKEGEFVYEIDYKLVDISLESAKDLKKDEILLKFKENLENLEGGLNVDDVGVVDCGKQHLTNIQGLIKALENSELTEIDFRMFDNTLKKLNLTELKKIEIAVILKGQELYGRKWILENAIQQATTLKEVKEIVWN